MPDPTSRSPSLSQRLHSPGIGSALARLLHLVTRIKSPLSQSGHALFRTMIDQIPDFIFVKDLESRFIMANAAICKAYGLSPDDLIGKTDFDLHPQDRAEGFYRLEQQIIRSGEPIFDMEESFPDSHGARKFYSTTKVPLRDDTGQPLGLIGVGRDITERKVMQAFEMQQAKLLAMIATNEDLRTVLSELATLIESQLTGIRVSLMLLDPDSGTLCHGAAPSLPEDYCTAIDGLPVGPSVGSCGTAAYRREPVIVTNTQSDPLWSDFRHLARRFGLMSCWSTPIIAHDGILLGTFALYSSEVRSPNAEEYRLVEVATRIAEIAIGRYRSERQLLHMAHYDALTGLPNRVYFLKQLKADLEARSTRNRKLALLYIDLDRFKQVNDRLGHLVGDRLLAHVGARLRSFASADISVARLGGDEFAMVRSFEQGFDRTRGADLATAIITALSTPVEIDGAQIVAGATVGIAIAPDDVNDPDLLLRDADLALYQAKAEARGGIRFFDPAMTIRAKERHQMEIDLRRALDCGEFLLHYQPTVSLETGEISGFEALVRWQHPERGMVAPQDFIPLAEELGLIAPIGRWVLDEACRQAALWPSSLVIAVNLSPVQFRDGQLFQTVVSALSRSGLPPSRLELEITESVLLVDNENNLGLLHRLRTLGVQISLDDFGTGYSSLSYLRSFPFTKIKIDRSFVRDLESSPGCLAIIRAVCRLAADLEIATIAEGIETDRQVAQLRVEGCQAGQGFLFSPPMPAERATQLIALGFASGGAQPDRALTNPPSARSETALRPAS